MSFPRYPKYKDSGVEWLGDVPEHWGLVSLRYTFQNLDYKRVPLAGEDRADVEKIYPYYGASGIIDYVPDFLFDETLILVAEDGANLLSRSSPLAFVATGKYWVNNHAHILKPTSGSLAFWVALLQTYDYTPIVTGAAQPKLTADRLGSIRLPTPPPAEQTAIASFLDAETSKIDALIAEQRRLIELLKEKRQAVISHAVTKGLNPDAPMKASGIEWLGDVPEHWEVLTIQRISTKITNGYVGPTRDILVEEGVPYAQATHIKQGRVNFDGSYFVTKEWSESHAKSILAEGDVLIVQTGAGTGDVGLVSRAEVGFNCHALIIVACDRDQLSGPFLAAVLQSEYGRQKLESIQTGGMHPHLNCGNVKFVDVPVPPDSEQEGIVQYIREASGQFDDLVAEATHAIDLLQERRTALISAAVTGKIDVREFANWEAA